MGRLFCTIFCNVSTGKAKKSSECVEIYSFFNQVTSSEWRLNVLLTA
jgi:hypothetical protein